MEKEPAVIAEQNKADILRSAGEKVGIAKERLEAELSLLIEQSFKSEERKNGYGFLVLHSSGTYGVSADLTEEGKLTNLACRAV
jgi:hypothetical protein